MHANCISIQSMGALAFAFLDRGMEGASVIQLTQPLCVFLAEIATSRRVILQINLARAQVIVLQRFLVQ